MSNRDFRDMVAG